MRHSCEFVRLSHQRRKVTNFLFSSHSSVPTRNTHGLNFEPLSGVHDAWRPIMVRRFANWPGQFWVPFGTEAVCIAPAHRGPFTAEMSTSNLGTLLRERNKIGHYANHGIGLTALFYAAFGSIYTNSGTFRRTPHIFGYFPRTKLGAMEQIKALCRSNLGTLRSKTGTFRR